VSRLGTLSPMPNFSEIAMCPYRANLYKSRRVWRFWIPGLWFPISVQ